MPEKCRLKMVLDPGAILPERAHPDDAGLDLIAPKEIYVWPGQRVLIDTGVHVQIPQGNVGLITSKSGLMQKCGILTSGTIDSGYTGRLRVILFNTGGQRVQIQEGQKVAQLVIFPIITPEIEVVDKLDETERGDGGFGSTGDMAKGGDVCGD